MYSQFEAWKKYRVTDVATPEEFVRRYYKPDRITHMLRDYPDYFDTLVASRKSDLEREGVTIISHHDSVTGQVVVFYPPAMIEGAIAEAVSAFVSALDFCGNVSEAISQVAADNNLTFTPAEVQTIKTRAQAAWNRSRASAGVQPEKRSGYTQALLWDK